MNNKQLEIMRETYRNDLYFFKEEERRDIHELVAQGYVRIGRFGPRDWEAIVLTPMGITTMAKVSGAMM